MNRRELLIGRSAKAKQADAIANESGATAVEYRLIGGIMAVALVSAMPKLAKRQKRNYNCIKRAMKGKKQSKFCKRRNG